MSHTPHPPSAKISASILKRFIEEWLATSGDSFDSFRHRIAITVEARNALYSGEGYVHFGQADKIVSYIDVFAWQSDPELAAEYQRVDLAWIDEHQPVGRKIQRGGNKRPGGRTHGKIGTYSRGCRCDPCKQSRKDYYQQQKREHQKRQRQLARA